MLTASEQPGLSEPGLHHRHGASAAQPQAVAPRASQAALVTNGSGGGSSDKVGAPSEAEASEAEFLVQPATYREIAKHFGILGWTSFGGPAAHIAMFQKVCNKTKHWWVGGEEGHAGRLA